MNRFFDEIIQIIKPLKIQNILDVGCGEGFTLKRIYDSGIKSKAEGIEYLDSAIKIGKKENPSIKIKKGTIYKLPYPDNKFDLVICTEVLEHLENPELALMELKRVSNKYVLISVPNEPFFMLANLLRGKNISRWGNDIEHINHWTFCRFRI
jgi:ubiquinone/menaquinone biosynthesis C-methylase UbiE